MYRERNPSVLTEMQMNAASTKISVEIPQKPEIRTAMWSSHIPG